MSPLIGNSYLNKFLFLSCGFLCKSCFGIGKLLLEHTESRFFIYRVLWWYISAVATVVESSAYSMTILFAFF